MTQDPTYGWNKANLRDVLGKPAVLKQVRRPIGDCPMEQGQGVVCAHQTPSDWLTLCYLQKTIEKEHRLFSPYSVSRRYALQHAQEQKHHDRLSAMSSPNLYHLLSGDDAYRYPKGKVSWPSSTFRQEARRAPAQRLLDGTPGHRVSGRCSVSESSGPPFSGSRGRSERCWQ